MRPNPVDVIRRRADGSLDMAFYLRQGRRARSDGWRAVFSRAWGLLGRRFGRLSA